MGRNQIKNRAVSKVDIGVGQHSHIENKQFELNKHIYGQLDFKEEGNSRFTVINRAYDDAWDIEAAQMRKQIEQLSAENDFMRQMEEGLIEKEPDYILSKEECDVYNDQNNWFVECDVCYYNTSPCNNEPDNEKCKCTSTISEVVETKLQKQSIIQQNGEPIECFIPKTLRIPVEILV